ncbi:hypothetical protein GCM10010238_64790 [Streptomyces griseoviridis]|uniref:Uncharacterized protein n=2 Tax=Streptomyces griseoviridis TaxID=45398 RepID=A0A918GUT8_STRGD|nr:hypothetical protein GCM10010238_64790 [Streptomyces niveoruber]
MTSMTEPDGVLIAFAGGDTADRQVLARRLTDTVVQRGARATVLDGPAIPAGLRAALVLQVTGGPRGAEPIVVPPGEPDPLDHLLRELERRGLPPASAAAYSPDEEDEVARRLEALGYID